MWLTRLSWKWFTNYQKVLFKGPWASSNKNFKRVLNVKYDIVAWTLGYKISKKLLEIEICEKKQNFGTYLARSWPSTWRLL